MPTPASPSATDSSATGFLAGAERDLAVRSPATTLADSRLRLADPRGARVVGRPQPVVVAGARAQLVETALRRRCAPARMIATRLHSSSTSRAVARQQHGDPVCPPGGGSARACPACRRVEPGGGLVEQQQPRAAQQRRGDAEPLAHAVRVAADAVAGPVGEIDDVERLVDPRARVAAVERRQELEVLAARRGRDRSAAPPRTPPRPRARARLASGSPAEQRAPARRSAGSGPSIIRSDVVLPAPLGPR